MVSGWSVMLSLKHNFLFIHTSKTGGNSIQSALLDYSEDYLEDLPHSSKSKDFEVRNAYFKSLKKHTTLYDYQQCLGEQKIKTLYKFGCVRNPWERAILVGIISLFIKKRTSRMKLDYDNFESLDLVDENHLYRYNAEN